MERLDFALHTVYLFSRPIRSFGYTKGRGWQRTRTGPSNAAVASSSISASGSSSNTHLRDDAQFIDFTPTKYCSYTRCPPRLVAACISTQLSLGSLTVPAGATPGSVAQGPTATTTHLHGILRLFCPFRTQYSILNLPDPLLPALPVTNNPFSWPYPVSSSSNASTSPSRPTSQGSTRLFRHPTFVLPPRVCGVQRRRFGQLKWWYDDTPWQTPQPFLPLAWYRQRWR